MTSRAAKPSRVGRISSGRSGISIVEITVVLLVVSLLISIAAVSLPNLRELAHRKNCANNLRVLGTALSSYTDTNGVLPPGAFWGSEGIDLPHLLSHQKPTPIQVTRQNWVQLLLPYLGADELAGRFRANSFVVDEANAGARMTDLAVMTCPSDPYNRRDNLYVLPLASGQEAKFARGNYAINGGPEFIPANFGTLADPAPTANRYVYSEETRQFQWWGSGIAGINKCFPLREIENGLGTTVAIDEIRAGLAAIDPRGVWALGQIASSMTWGHGVTGDASGPNYGGKLEIDDGADDIFRGEELHELLGTYFINAERMQCCKHCSENVQATARSKHPGGVQVLMLDGALRFVADAIDPTVWHLMHSRETPPALLQERLESELDGPDWTPTAKVSSAVKRADANRAASPSELVNTIGMHLIAIPSGEFLMGVADANNRFAYPVDAIPHRVRITRPFYLGAFEVTQREYNAVMGSNPSWHSPRGGGQASLKAAKINETAQFPVENVSWNDAVEFCTRLSQLPAEKSAARVYRLPTEAEWEYACRAGTSAPIPRHGSWTGDDKTGEIAGMRDVPRTLLVRPVGSYAPNRFGLHDMCGNVYEWVSDFRRRDAYSQSSLDDPTGPSDGFFHVVRGWYWVATGPACKVYVAQEPWTGSRFIGFRVALDVGTD